MDIDPDTRDATVTDIQTMEYDKDDLKRFTLNSNTLNDLVYVRILLRTIMPVLQRPFMTAKKGSMLF